MSMASDIDVNIQQGRDLARELLNILHREVIVRYPYRTAGVLFLLSYYPRFPFRILRFGLWTIPLSIAIFPFHLLYFGLYVVPRSIIRGILACLGFQRGIRADSFASNYQSRHYGGYTPRNSMFSNAQSYGATDEFGLHSYANKETSHTHPIWNLVGWLFLWEAFVVLWKYGPLRTE